MTSKHIISVVLAAVIGMAIVGGYYYPKASPLFAGSPAGSTFSTAKVAQINFSPQSRTSTSTSLLNTDASDRVVTDGFVSCTGLTTSISSTGGVATLNFDAATSSAAAPTTSIAASSFKALAVSLATSTVFNYTASSTYAVPWGQIWRSGEYMVFQTNATSSAMACTIGVHYLAS